MLVHSLVMDVREVFHFMNNSQSEEENTYFQCEANFVCRKREREPPTHQA